MSFSANIAKYAKRTKLSTDDAIRSIVLQLFGSVVELTPVDKGRAKGNWQYSNSPVNGEVNLFDKTGKETIRKIKSGYDTRARTHYLTSNLPYIGDLENGSSDQAPNGMVKRSIDSIKIWLAKFK